MTNYYQKYTLLEQRRDNTWKRFKNLEIGVEELEEELGWIQDKMDELQELEIPVEVDEMDASELEVNFDLHYN